MLPLLQDPFAAAAAVAVTAAAAAAAAGEIRMIIITCLSVSDS